MWCWDPTSSSSSPRALNTAQSQMINAKSGCWSPLANTGESSGSGCPCAEGPGLGIDYYWDWIDDATIAQL